MPKSKQTQNELSVVRYLRQLKSCSFLLSLSFHFIAFFNLLAIERPSKHRLSTVTFPPCYVCWYLRLAGTTRTSYIDRVILVVCGLNDNHQVQLSKTNFKPPKLALRQRWLRPLPHKSTRSTSEPDCQQLSTAF